MPRAGNPATCSGSDGVGSTPSLPFPRFRRGPDTTLRLKRSASPGPLFRVGITKKPRGKATLINLSFPLVPFPHALGVGPTRHCA